MKICTVCELDVAQQPRAKDGAGRYFCKPCWTAVTEDLLSLPCVRRCGTCDGRFPEGELALVDDIAHCGDCLAAQRAKDRRTIMFSVAGGLVALLIIGAYPTYRFVDSRWERNHHDRIVSLTQEGEAAVARDDPKAALASYNSLFELLDGREVRSPTLQAEIEEAQAAREALQPQLAAIVEKEQRLVRAKQAYSEAQGLGGRGPYENRQRSMELFEQAADLGLPEAMTEVGHSYSPLRNTLREDREKSVEWYRRAAEAGDPDGMYYLGRAYIDGIGIKPDEEEAERWFQQAAGPLKVAAESGDPEAMLAFGVLQIAGMGTQEDPEAGIALIRRAAEDGHTWSMLQLAELHVLNENGDDLQVILWARRAAEAGNPHAMVLLSALLADTPSEANWEEAFQWAIKASNTGLPAGMTRLGLYFHLGMPDVQDFVQAKHFYEMASEAGSTEAMVCMAHLLLEGGYGVGRNPGIAALWLERAAERGNAVAMLDLAVLYHEGTQISGDAMKAAEWYHAALDAGEMGALAPLAEIYLDGKAIKSNPEQALYLAKQAAELKDPAGMKVLERIYREGLGVQPDERQADEWGRRAMQTMGMSERLIDLRYPARAASTQP